MEIKISKKGLLLSLLATFVAFSAAAYQHAAVSELSTEAIPLEQLPKTIGQWRGQDTPGGLADDVRNILKLDKFIKRVYANPEGEVVVLYIGYWLKQSGEHQAAKHSPSICLPSNGWNITRQPKEKFIFEDAKLGELDVKRLIGGVRDRQSLFTYWFFTGEHTYNEEWSALTRISLEAAIYGRSDGGIVEISAPISQDKDITFEQALADAKRRTDDFLRSLYPELHLITTLPNSTP